MSRRHYPYDVPVDGYPGQSYPSTDLTDEAQFWGLGPNQGDENPAFRAGRPWGKVVELRANDRQTPIGTEIFIRPVVFAVRFRFSLVAEGPFSPRVPITYGGTINIRLIESFDLKSGDAVEDFSLSAGLVAPVCKVLARSLTVTLSLPLATGESDPGPIFVQAVAAPLFDVECDEVSGRGSYATATVTRIPTTSTIPQTFLFSNQLRKQFVVENHSTQALAILFGHGVSLTSGAENFSILIPANARYESPIGGYGGFVEGIWAGADATGEALITEGV